MIKLPDIII